MKKLLTILFISIVLHAQDTTKTDSMLVKFETDLKDVLKEKEQVDKIINEYNAAKLRIEGIEIYLRNEIKKRKQINGRSK